MTFTEREMKMPLGLVEAEYEKARLVEEKWRDTPDEGYVDGPEALASERSFSTGVATGVLSMKNLIDEVLNA